MLFRIFRRLPPPKPGTVHFGTPAIVEGAPGTSAGGERKWLGCLGWLRPSWNLKRLHRHQISYFPSTAGSYFFQVTMDIVTSLEHRFCFRFQTFKKQSVFDLALQRKRKIAPFSTATATTGQTKRWDHGCTTVPASPFSSSTASRNQVTNLRQPVEVFDAQVIVVFWWFFESLLAAPIVG